MKRVMLLLATLLTATLAHAQPNYQTKTISGSTCPGDGCMVIETAGLGSAGIQITGTFSGTVSFEQIIDRDNGAWVSWPVTANGATTTVTTATAAGVWVGNVVGINQVRVRFSSYTSGSAIVGTVRSSAKAGGGGNGTVTSVALTMPTGFSVSGSPVTSTGTLAVTLSSESANSFLAAPNGSAGTPSFRAIVAADVPTLNQNTSGTAANVSGTPALPNGTTATTQSQADASTKLATTAYVDTGLATKATVASPTFTGGVATLTAPAATDAKVKIKAATSGGYAAAIEYWQDNAQKWQTGVGLQGGATFVLQNVTNSIAALQISELGAITVTDPPTAGAGADYLCMSTGKVINQGVTCAASAARFKTNVVPLEHGLDYLAKFQPSTFDWIHNKSSAIGLIADQVAEVDPRLAVYQKDDIEWTEWEEGELAPAVRIGDFVSTPAIRGWVEVPKRMRSDKETIFSTNDKAIIAVLIKAVQEQQEQIKVLQAKLGIQ